MTVGTLEEMFSKPMVVALWDHDVGSTNDPLGKVDPVELDIAQLRETSSNGGKLDFDNVALTGVKHGTVTFSVQWVKWTAPTVPMKENLTA